MLKKPQYTYALFIFLGKYTSNEPKTELEKLDATSQQLSKELFNE